MYFLFFFLFFTGIQKVEDDDDFVNQLKDVDDLVKQLEIFKSNLQVDFRKNYENYDRVYQDLYMSLSEYFPYCQINPFGSTVTGLCFRNSDVDVYISGINKGDNSVQYLYSIKDILNRSRKFVNIIVIAHAKIPIVKCIHKDTHINCDINLKNMLGVCNSKLIKYYINIDRKIKDMVVILKYWARVHKITGQNHLFTNYALCLMVIFFLQQKPYNLPSVLCLQKYNRFYKEDFWNGGFNELNVYRTTIETLMRSSLLEMLMGFFNFYFKFDYSKNVICPYLGKILEKEIFKTPEALPNYYNMYKEYVKIEGNHPLKLETCICIQDPFEHSRNTTSVILNTVLFSFVNFCELGYKLCGAGTNNLLYKLFTEDLNVEKKIAQVSGSKDVGTFVIPMGKNMKYLQKKIQESNKSLDRIIAEREAWYETVVEFMKIVLKNFMGFEIQEDNEEVPAKNMKENNQTNVHDSETVHFKCSGKLNLWDNRKNKLKELKSAEFDKKNFVEKEIAITDCLKTGWGFNPTVKIVEFDFFLKFSSDPPSADISIKKISCYKNTFRSFSSFFVSNVKAWFLQYEDMLNHECSQT